MRDSKTTHFLKHFPAWIVLTVLFLVVLTFYVRTNDQFFQRVVDTILGALLGILTGRWFQPNQMANTTTGDVVDNQTNLNLSDSEIKEVVENIKEEEK